MFLQNAKKLDVNIADVDFLVISHGHYDHGGGLNTFLTENSKAEVFLHRLAFEKYYAIRPNNKFDYIGLNENLKENKQIVLTSDRFFITDGIQAFSNIVQRESRPKSNNGLLTEYKGQTVDDTFAHEQNLVIEEDGKNLLITGGAHNGIVNILEHFYSFKGRMPNYVIGGFHLSSRSGNGSMKCVNAAMEPQRIIMKRLTLKIFFWREGSNWLGKDGRDKMIFVSISLKQACGLLPIVSGRQESILNFSRFHRMHGKPIRTWCRTPVIRFLVNDVPIQQELR